MTVRTQLFDYLGYSFEHMDRSTYTLRIVRVSGLHCTVWSVNLCSITGAETEIFCTWLALILMAIRISDNCCRTDGLTWNLTPLLVRNGQRVAGLAGRPIDCKSGKNGLVIENASNSSRKSAKKEVTLAINQCAIGPWFLCDSHCILKLKTNVIQT